MNVKALPFVRGGKVQPAGDRSRWCYHEPMPVKRTSYAVYNTKIIWYEPQNIGSGVPEKIRRWVERLWRQIAEDFSFGIEELELAKDDSPYFMDFPPRHAIPIVVGFLKSISARRMFQSFPELQEQLWKGEFGENGYFVWTVGDVVIALVNRKYIRYYRHKE